MIPKAIKSERERESKVANESQSHQIKSLHEPPTSTKSQRLHLRFFLLDENRGCVFDILPS